MGSRNISERGAACDIRTVCKGLQRDLPGIADLVVNCCRISVSRIFLIAVIFEHNTTV